MYKCDFCGNEYLDRLDYLVHYSSHRRRSREGKKTRSVMTECKFCGKGFDNPLKLGGHTSSCSMNPNKNRRSEKLSKSNSSRKWADESKEKIRESMKKAHIEGRAWNIGRSRWNNRKSYPEEFFTKVIENEFLDKNFHPEYPVGIYSLDFAWVHKKRCIEIDGEQHERYLEYRERDSRKDKYLKDNGWEILRIKWKDMYSETKKWIEIAKKHIDEEN